MFINTLLINLYTMKKIIFMLLLSLVLVSCSNTTTEQISNISKENKISSSNTNITTSQKSNLITTKYNIENMTCVSCAYWIEYSWKSIPWVIDANVDYDTKIWTVTYEYWKVSQVNISKAAEPYIINIIN